MAKTLKRLFCAWLSIVMLAGTLVACSPSDDQTDPTGTTDITTESPIITTAVDYYASIPDGVRYDGQTYNILSYDATTWDIHLTSESGISGSLVDDAAYKRNLEIETMLGVAIEVTKIPHAEMVTRIATDNTSNQSEFDLICFWATTNMAPLLVGNQLYDWSQLEYVDLSADWYNQTANEAFSIAERQYFAVSDLTYPVQQHFRFLCNLDLLDQYNLEMPYQHVYNGSWTHAKLMEYVANFYSDKNANGEKDLGDIFGLSTTVNGVSRFVNNWGQSPVSATDSGFTVNIYSEELVGMVEAMNDLLWATGTNYGSNNDDVYDSFEAGESLFEIYTSDPVALLEIEGFDYGYLPYPKYNEKQENYITVTHGGIMAIPSRVDEPERAGIIIEALSAASTKYIEPAFIQTFIESRVLRDEDSVNMYRLMRDTAFYDISRTIDAAGYFSGLSYYTELLKRNNSDLSARKDELSRLINRKYSELFDKIKA